MKSDMFVVSTVPNTLTDHEKQLGWRLLFNGTNSEGWRGTKQKAFPEQGWSIGDGVLIIEAAKEGNTRPGDIITEEKFSAFDLAFDFKLTEGANSGVKYFVTLSDGDVGSALGLEYQVLDDERHPDATFIKSAFPFP